MPAETAVRPGRDVLREGAGPVKILDQVAGAIRRVADQIAPIPAPTATAASAGPPERLGLGVIARPEPPAGVFTSTGSPAFEPRPSGDGVVVVSDSRTARGAAGRPASFGDIGPLPVAQPDSLPYGVSVIEVK